jgi:hypothetical protein
LTAKKRFIKPQVSEITGNFIWLSSTVQKAHDTARDISQKNELYPGQKDKN